jgi:hypothetical protein
MVLTKEHKVAYRAYQFSKSDYGISGLVFAQLWQ